MNIAIERVCQYLGEEVIKRRLLEDEVATMQVQFAHLQEALRASSEDKPGGRREDEEGEAEGDQGGRSGPEGNP